MISLGLGLSLGQAGAGAVEELTDANAVETDVDATTGWTSTADVFQSQSGVTSGSSFAFEVNANAAPAPASRASRSLASLTLGVTYKITLDARHVGTGLTWRVALGSSEASMDNVIIQLLNSSITFMPYELVFVHSASTAFIVVRENNGGNTGGVYLDNVSIKKQS